MERATCNNKTHDEQRAYNECDYHANECCQKRELYATGRSENCRRKRECYVAHCSEKCRQQCECYAAEGPQLSVANRKFVGIARRPFIDDSVDRHALGPLNLHCDYCNVTHYSCERVGGTVNAPQFTACCNKGRLTDVLQLLPELPDELENLLSINNERS